VWEGLDGHGFECVVSRYVFEDLVRREWSVQLSFNERTESMSNGERL
jgi:hypothetical protein